MRAAVALLLLAACGPVSHVPARTSRCGVMAMSEQLGPHSITGTVKSVEYIAGPRHIAGTGVRVRIAERGGVTRELRFIAEGPLPLVAGDAIDARLSCVENARGRTCDAHISVAGKLVLAISRGGDLPAPDGWAVELGPAIPGVSTETDRWVHRDHTLLAQHGETSVELGKSDTCHDVTVAGERWRLFGVARKTEWKGEPGAAGDREPPADLVTYSITRDR